MKANPFRKNHMLRLRKENKLIKDDKGYAMGCIASIEESTKIKNTLDLIFKVGGTEGEITLHLFPSIVLSARKDDEGQYNMMTQLCLNLGFLTQEELEKETFDANKVNDQFMALEGQVVRFKMLKQKEDKNSAKGTAKVTGKRKAITLDQIDVGTLEMVK